MALGRTSSPLHPTAPTRVSAPPEEPLTSLLSWPKTKLGAPAGPPAGGEEEVLHSPQCTRDTHGLVAAVQPHLHLVSGL